jgi:hypothetical protein
VLRARGFVPGGGISDWFVESVQSVFSLVAPAILTDDSSFGVVSNRFGFNVRAVAGQVMVVEASSNLAQWTALATNTVSSSGRFYFSDGDGAGASARFYRARLWP